jgi:cytochrome P450
MSEAATALYPPTVTPPAAPLGIFAFLARCTDNPLATIPAFAYTDLVTAIEPIKGYKVLWVCDPEWIERILVRDWEQYAKTELERRIFAPVVGDGVLSANGSNWRWQRRALAPLFRHGEIARYVPDMIAAAGHCIDGWRAAGGGSVRPIDADMMSVTFDVIVRTMLFGGAPGDVRAVMQSGSAYLEATPWEIGYGILGLPAWLPHPAKWRLARSARAMRRAVGAIIDDRRRRIDDARSNGAPDGAGSDDSGDLLGRLLAARDPETDAPLTQDQLVDNLATLLEAGHETTAKALTWSLYLLARAPEWQARVRDEVAAVVGPGRMTAGHVEQLAVTERVIKEAMRLYPPAPMLSRTPLAPVTIAGHHVAPGQQVLMPVFAIHRHRRLWSDPDRFDPDRFLPERERDVSRTQYLPFGAGPRICLGASFALVEAKALLASFVRAASFEWDGRHLPEPQSRITLHPKGGMPLKVTVL